MRSKIAAVYKWSAGNLHVECKIIGEIMSTGCVQQSSGSVECLCLHVACREQLIENKRKPVYRLSTARQQGERTSLFLSYRRWRHHFHLNPRRLLLRVIYALRRFHEVRRLGVGNVDER